jgi:hypothetical protein
VLGWSPIHCQTTLPSATTRTARQPDNPADPAVP